MWRLPGTQGTLPFEKISIWKVLLTWPGDILSFRREESTSSTAKILKTFLFGHYCTVVAKIFVRDLISYNLYSFSESTKFSSIWNHARIQVHVTLSTLGVRKFITYQSWGKLENENFTLMKFLRLQQLRFSFTFLSRFDHRLTSFLSQNKLRLSSYCWNNHEPLCEDEILSFSAGV